MKYHFTLFALLFTLTSAVAQSPLEFERATLAITYRAGAQVIEFSSMQLFQTRAIFDPGRTVYSSQQYINNNADLDWEQVQLLGFLDNRYSLRYLDELAHLGWEITETKLTSQPPDYEQNHLGSQTSVYMLSRPAGFSPLVEKEVVTGILGPESLPFRAKVLAGDGQHWIQLETKVNNHRWVPTLSAYGILPADEAEFQKVFRFLRFENGYLVLGLNLETEGEMNQMTYRFYPNGRGDLPLVEVDKQIGAPCGDIELARFLPANSKFKIYTGTENCSVDGPSSLDLVGISHQAFLNRRPKTFFSSFVPGIESIRISRKLGYFVY